MADTLITLCRIGRSQPRQFSLLWTFCQNVAALEARRTEVTHELSVGIAQAEDALVSHDLHDSEESFLGKLQE